MQRFRLSLFAKIDVIFYLLLLLSHLAKYVREISNDPRPCTEQFNMISKPTNALKYIK